MARRNNNNQRSRALGRHTRRNPAGPVWQGLDTSVQKQIRSKGLKAAQGPRSDIFWAATLPPPPPIRLAQPIQVRGPPAAWVPGILSYWHTPQPIRIPLLDQILGSGAVAAGIFSHLDRRDYDNLRLTSKHFASLLPHAFGLNGVGHANIASLPQQCEDYKCVQPRHFQIPTPGLYLWLRQDTRPGLVAGWPTFNLHQRCPRIHRSRLNNGVQVMPCQGTRLGYNTQNGIAHSDPVYICRPCIQLSRFNWDTVYWHGTRILPLCFMCSAERMQTEHWEVCTCQRDQQSSILCDPCFLIQYEDMLREAKRRCKQLGLRKRWNPTPKYLTGAQWERLQHFVNDWDPTNRNYCICGLDYEAIKASYPKRLPMFNGPGAPTSVGAPIPDYTHVFRMCLICGKHTTHAGDQLYRLTHCI